MISRNTLKKKPDAVYSGIVRDKEAFQQQYDDESEMEEFKGFADYN